MAKQKTVWVALPETEQRRAKARLRGQEAVRKLAAAEREYNDAMVEVDRELGPDPRAAGAIEAVIGEFCAQIVGRPSIPSA